MRIHYDAKTDLLYIRLDERRQKAINKRISDEIVLDIGKGRKIVGIEILDASKRLNIKGLIPSKIEIVPEAAHKARA
jgi:uncharacterized protein YuzE